MKINQFSSLEERFFSRIEMVPESGCWIWMGHIGVNGYGQIKENYATRTAHRVSYEIHNGSVPDGLFVLHHCDIPCCVNPSHLYAGTAKQNTADAVNRGRLNPVRGKNHHNAKLSNEEVIEIYNSKEHPCDIAIKYGISTSYAWQIKRGDRKAWLTNASKRIGNIT